MLCTWVKSWMLLPLLAGSLLGADAKQVTESTEGKRAFDDLGAFYAKNANKVPYVQALKDLAGNKASGAYILALFKQAFADETNGRAPVKRSPFFGGGGTNSDARVFRQELAQAFAKEAQGGEALEALRWLLEEEKSAPNQAAGLEALKRIQGPKAVELLRKLLAQPHPVAAVAKGAVEAAAERGLKELAPEIKKLCGHYRTAVREAARAAAPKLGVADLPEYKPQAAFTPWLEEQLNGLCAMLVTELPKGAEWKRFTVAGGEKERAFSGWQFASDKGAVKVLDWFGAEELLPNTAKAGARTLAEEAKDLLALRGGGKDLSSLSRRGGMTSQFEPKFVTLPEALVGAWCFKAGDKASAAALLFPRLDAMADDRWLGWVARDLLGHYYFQKALDLFTHERDYVRAEGLCLHLAKPVFDEYTYQKRAQELATQLANRRDDFGKFALPKPGDWEKLRKGMKREDQIKYLAEHLRLLNCIQMGQPGDVNYADPQTAESYVFAQGKGTPVINPYTELRALNLQPADLPALVPFLSDENYMPAYSYWRDFHTKRTLHQVNWAVASLLDEAAKKRLADLGALQDLDAAGRKQHLDKILAWCKENAGKTRDQLPDELPKRPAGGPRIDAP